MHDHSHDEVAVDPDDDPDRQELFEDPRTEEDRRRSDEGEASLLLRPPENKRRPSKARLKRRFFVFDTKDFARLLLEATAEARPRKPPHRGRLLVRSKVAETMAVSEKQALSNVRWKIREGLIRRRPEEPPIDPNALAVLGEADWDRLRQDPAADPFAPPSTTPGAEAVPEAPPITAMLGDAWLSKAELRRLDRGLAEASSSQLELRFSDERPPPPEPKPEASCPHCGTPCPFCDGTLLPAAPPRERRTAVVTVRKPRRRGTVPPGQLALRFDAAV